MNSHLSRRLAKISIGEGMLVLCLCGCGAPERPKPPERAATRVATEQAPAPADAFDTLPDAAPPASSAPMVFIEFVDASAPLSSVWPSPPPPLKDPCGGGPTLRRLGSDPAAPARVATPFDRGAAATALARVDVSACATPGGPLGSGHVKVTFAPSGSITVVEVDSPPFAGTGVGRCVATKFRDALIPAFSGGCVTMGKSFTVLR